MPEALTKLIDEHIFADGKRDEWKDFRHKKLWTLEVDDTFMTNMDSCMLLFKKYFTPRQKTYSFQNAQEMFLV